jgi:hypothetical protein
MQIRLPARIAAVLGGLVLVVTMGVAGPVSPASAAGPASPTPSCSATSGVTIDASCQNGSSTYDYVVHGGCFVTDNDKWAVTVGPASTTNRLHYTACSGVAVVVSVSVYLSSATPPPHPDPDLESVTEPTCSATTQGSWPQQGSFQGSCNDGNPAWRYAIHAACTGPDHSTALTIGSTFTTHSLAQSCPWGTYTPIVLQVVLFANGAAMPPHPDPQLHDLCGSFGGSLVCPY